VRPWRIMIAIIFALSGGPPAAALITSADSRKYCGPMAAGVITQSAFTSWAPLLSNRWTTPRGMHSACPGPTSICFPSTVQVNTPSIPCACPRIGNCPFCSRDLQLVNWLFELAHTGLCLRILNFASAAIHLRSIDDYLVHCGRLMQRIEDEDAKQLKSQHQ
jgi:hypothetical protein